MEKKKSSTTRKILYIVIVIFIVSLGWFSWVLKERFLPKQKIHYHAGFIVVKDTKLVSFSDTKYQNFRPCKTHLGEEEDYKSPQDEQIERAHLHDNVGDVVHVEASDSKWSDLFTNLKYPLDYSKSSAFLNGKEVTNFQNLQIKPYDSLVIFVGKTTEKDKFLAQAVKKSHILEAEKKSEDCGF